MEERTPDQIIQGGVSNNVTETDLAVVQPPAATTRTHFAEQHLKQFRAQCLVFLAFRNEVKPKKLHLEIALGNIFPKQDEDVIDVKGKEQSIDEGSSNLEVQNHFRRANSARESETTAPGSSATEMLSVSEANILKEAEEPNRMDENVLNISNLTVEGG